MSGQGLVVCLSADEPNAACCYCTQQRGTDAHGEEAGDGKTHFQAAVYVPAAGGGVGESLQSRASSTDFNGDPFTQLLCIASRTVSAIGANGRPKCGRRTTVLLHPCRMPSGRLQMMISAH